MLQIWGVIRCDWPRCRKIHRRRIDWGETAPSQLEDLAEDAMQQGWVRVPPSWGGWKGEVTAARHYCPKHGPSANGA